ncbi:hypothetical protein [Chryseobacterium arthrosphaerae]|uniref:DUF5050 domain-containing protein n=1 Tax=Chryseobacterium arthrosphaerae TaxID=651561 RepID=A0A1B8ZTF9_9FLAO|nr:hypothetical protein [Chryseobacterium arthrosphaerae]OCA74873.1 hypothetical protein BBI00_11260 [Chryseobacterium arthrosphaerae]
MNIRKILSLVAASMLLFNVSCSTDSSFEETIDGTLRFDSGVIISNEGGFTTTTSEVSYISNNLATVFNKIYGVNNNNEPLGKVLQSIGFNGDRAYLVSNIPNKIDIVDRYTFKKQTTVTSNLDGARYIAFSGKQYYVTNSNFDTHKRKLNIYNISDNSFVKSIDLTNAAEKVVEANGSIVVQSDGVGYDANWNAIPTGYTVTIVNPSTNVISQTVNLPNEGIIRDLISYKGNAYVLVSGDTNSFIYKINTANGTYETTTLTAIPKVQKLSADNDRFYFITNTNKIYAMTIGSSTIPVKPVATAVGDVYGFNVIDGKIFAADANYTTDGKVNVYDAVNGNLLRNFTAGIGTNGFYKN